MRWRYVVSSMPLALERESQVSTGWEAERGSECV